MISKQEHQTYKEIIKKNRRDRTAKEVATAYVIIVKHRQGLINKHKEIQNQRINLYK